jgi:lysophospholipase
MMHLYATPDNPIPAKSWVGDVLSNDGVQLRAARWKPVGKTASHTHRGTVFVVQGRGECIEFYFETIQQLRKRGFHVVSFDFRGQGGSQRLLADSRKGHVRDFDDYTKDVQAVYDEVIKPHTPSPCFALAHSTGAAVLLRMAHEGRLPFRRIVLVTPNIQIQSIGGKAWSSHLVRLMLTCGMGTSYVPGGGATSSFSRPFEGNVLTSDAKRYARNGDILDKHPHLALGDPTIAWLGASLRCGKDFEDPAYIRAIRVPTLIVAGAEGKVVSTRAIERFASFLPAGHMVTIPGALHSLLAENDVIREAFWRAFDTFLDFRD